jgi:hypothetical protein
MGRAQVRGSLASLGSLLSSPMSRGPARPGLHKSDVIWNYALPKPLMHSTQGRNSIRPRWPPRVRLLRRGRFSMWTVTSIGSGQANTTRASARLALVRPLEAPLRRPPASERRTALPEWNASGSTLGARSCLDRSAVFPHELVMILNGDRAKLKLGRQQLWSQSVHC